MSGNQWQQWYAANKKRKDNLGTKAGFDAFANAAPRAPLELVTRSRLEAMSQDEREWYEDCRQIVNANLPVMSTPQMKRAHKVAEIVGATAFRDSEYLRTGLFLDADPGVGKTTIAQQYAKTYARGVFRREGHITDDGSQRLPVVYAGAKGKTLKGLLQALVAFYDPSPGRTGTRVDLQIVLEGLIQGCGTELIVIDDIHQIKPYTDDGGDVIDYLKSLVNSLAVTFIHTGVNLEKKGFYGEGQVGDEALSAQTGRRMVRVGVAPFDTDTPEHKEAWLRCLNSLESALMLIDAQPGDLAALSEEWLARTQGRIGSLTAQINSATKVAIMNGTERITAQVLAETPLDHTSEVILKSQRNGTRTPPASRRKRPSTAA